MYSGTVEAKGEGHGTRSDFVIQLPAVVPISVNVPENVDPRSQLRKVRRRVLIANANRDAAMILAMMLRIMGDETQAAHDGQEDFDIVLTFRPDISFLDIGMPRLNGYDVARCIRKKACGHGVMLVALTGWG